MKLITKQEFESQINTRNREAFEVINKAINVSIKHSIEIVVVLPETHYIASLVVALTLAGWNIVDKEYIDNNKNVTFKLK